MGVDQQRRRAETSRRKTAEDGSGGNIHVRLTGVPVNLRGFQVGDELDHLLVFLPCLMGLAETAAVRLAQELDPGLEGFLLRGDDCCGHVVVPGVEGFMSTTSRPGENVISNYQYILKIL